MFLKKVECLFLLIEVLISYNQFNNGIPKYKSYNIKLFSFKNDSFYHALCHKTKSQILFFKETRP